MAFCVQRAAYAAAVEKTSQAEERSPAVATGLVAAECSAMMRGSIAATMTRSISDSFGSPPNEKGGIAAALSLSISAA